jgi:hypothetical protein
MSPNGQATARELLAADSSELDDLVLADSKSQGAEYPAIVIPFSTNTSRCWSSHAEIAACVAQVVRDPIHELAGGGRRIRTTGPSRDRVGLSCRTGGAAGGEEDSLESVAYLAGTESLCPSRRAAPCVKKPVERIRI